MRILEAESRPSSLWAASSWARRRRRRQAGTSPFKWYVGGQGGVTSFRTNAGGRELMPVGGGHIADHREAHRPAALGGSGLRVGRADADAVRDPRQHRRDGQLRRQQLDVPGHPAVLGDPHGLSGPERRTFSRSSASASVSCTPLGTRRAVRRRQHRERPEQHAASAPRSAGLEFRVGPLQRLRPVPDHHQAGVKQVTNGR